MGTWLSSKLGKVKGGEEKEWRPTSVTPLLSTGWLFNSHFPIAINGCGSTLVTLECWVMPTDIKRLS